jgi:hypothetical protein
MFLTRFIYLGVSSIPLSILYFCSLLSGKTFRRALIAGHPA